MESSERNHQPWNLLSQGPRLNLSSPTHYYSKNETFAGHNSLTWRLEEKLTCVWVIEMVGNGLKAAAHGMKGKLLVWGGCWWWTTAEVAGLLKLRTPAHGLLLSIDSSAAVHSAAGDWNLSVGTRKTKLLWKEKDREWTLLSHCRETAAAHVAGLEQQRSNWSLLLSWPRGTDNSGEERKCSYYRSRLLLLSVAGWEPETGAVLKITKIGVKS